MFNSLYNRIKESEFEDLFQPISDEELEVRMLSKLNNSTFEYLTSGDIEGVCIFDFPSNKAPKPEDLANILDVIANTDSRVSYEVFEIDISVSDVQITLSPRSGYGSRMTGKFEGSFTMLDSKSWDAGDISSDFDRRVEEELGEDAEFWDLQLELNDISVTTLEPIKRTEDDNNV